MSFSLQGFTVNLSFFQISDIIALILVLIITSFNIVPPSKVKSKWLRVVIYVGGSLIILIAQHFLIRNWPPFSNRLPSDLEVRWYGVLIMLGALAAVLMAAWGAKRKGLNPNSAWDMLPWLLIAGIIGARLWHVFTPMPNSGISTMDYFRNPISILEIWNGGLGIPGAVIGGALACWIYCRVKKQDFTLWTDIIAPGLVLAQAIGRWGNFTNQELYGTPTNFFMGISINGSAIRYHPVFLYESIWDLLIFGLLIFLSFKAAKKLIKGDILLIYVALYSFGRFWLEFIKTDPVKFNQYFMVVLFVLSGGYLLFKHLYSRSHQLAFQTLAASGAKSVKTSSKDDSMVSKKVSEQKIAQQKPTAKKVNSAKPTVKKPSADNQGKK
jgi:phosphatidylglycerol:prolipoprotein diacylglycerol transferase